MRTKRRRVQISQFLLRISHIEIQGRRANDIKHSTSWEATQVFLKLFLFPSANFYCLFLVILVVWLSPCSDFCLFVYFQDSRTQVLERIRSCCALQVQKVTFPSGEGFLAKRSSMCTIFTDPESSLSRRDVESQRRDVSMSRRLNVATLILSLSVTSQRGFSTSRRRF